MALAIRFIIKPGLAQISVNGRAYVPEGNGVVDVALPDALAVHDGIQQRLGFIGASTDRPTYDRNRVSWPPASMYDTTLSATIFSVPNTDPVQWVRVDGSGVSDVTLVCPVGVENGPPVHIAGRDFRPYMADPRDPHTVWLIDCPPYEASQVLQRGMGFIRYQPQEPPA